MESHFDSIGYRVDPMSYFVLCNKILSLGERVPIREGGAYLRYTTPEGAELWGQISPDEKLAGLQPHFVGSGRYRVTIRKSLDDPAAFTDGCLLVTSLDEIEDVRFVVSSPNYRALDRCLTTGGAEAVLQIVAMAHKIDVFTTAEEFKNTEIGEHLATESFIPCGMFEPRGKAVDPPQPLVLFSGVIRSAERRRNSYSDEEFWALEVKTLGGTLDVVAAPEQVSYTPVAGGIVHGTFYLSAIVTDFAPQSGESLESGPRSVQMDRPSAPPVSPVPSDIPESQQSPENPLLRSIKGLAKEAEEIRLRYAGQLRKKEQAQWRDREPVVWPFIFAGLLALTIAGIPVSIGLVVQGLRESKERKKRCDALYREIDFLDRAQFILGYVAVPHPRPLSLSDWCAPCTILGSLDPEIGFSPGFMMAIAFLLRMCYKELPTEGEHAAISALFDETPFVPGRRRRLPVDVANGKGVEVFDLVVDRDLALQADLEVPLIACMVSRDENEGIVQIPWDLVTSSMK